MIAAVSEDTPRHTAGLVRLKGNDDGGCLWRFKSEKPLRTLIRRLLSEDDED